MKTTKTVIALLFLTGIFFSCQQQQVSNQSTEIDVVKKSFDAVIKMDWAAYRSFFHDTAEVYINNWFHTRISPDQYMEGAAKHFSHVASFSIAPNTIYERVVTPNGHHVVHQWTELIYVLKDGREVRTPYHSVARVENNKIVFFGGIYNSLPKYLAEQATQKGSLVSIHIETIKLKPGVTLDQYKDYYINTAIPEYEKMFPGVKGYFLSAKRGKNKSSIGTMWVFASEKTRDLYFNSDDKLNELGKETFAKMKPITDKLNELGTSSSEFTDWIVQ